jgi:hypothetical protein
MRARIEKVHPSTGSQVIITGERKYGLSSKQVEEEDKDTLELEATHFRDGKKL